jgi:hypothetical protein
VLSTVPRTDAAALVFVACVLGGLVAHFYCSAGSVRRRPVL